LRAVGKKNGPLVAPVSSLSPMVRTRCLASRLAGSIRHVPFCGASFAALISLHYGDEGLSGHLQFELPAQRLQVLLLTLQILYQQTILLSPVGG
jgi:hypothetical protein